LHNQGLHLQGDEERMTKHPQKDIENPATLALWLYAAGVTDERPGGKKPRVAPVSIRRFILIRKTSQFRLGYKHPADMALGTLAGYYNGSTGPSLNWVFPGEMS
jgi:hypothetical protein